MNLMLKLLLLAALSWMIFILFGEISELRDLGPDDEGYDPTKVVMYFLLSVVIGIGIGLILTVTILPDIGERVGKFFYDSGEESERDPHADAIAQFNNGDYEGAVASYQKIVEKNPEDIHAISEAVRIMCERLGDYDEAAEYLEGFLQGELPAETTAFLAERLVDVHWDYRRDADLALPVLDQIMETMPDSKYSANAFHRQQDIRAAVASKPQEKDNNETEGSSEAEDNSETEDKSETEEHN